MILQIPLFKNTQDTHFSVCLSRNILWLIGYVYIKGLYYKLPFHWHLPLCDTLTNLRYSEYTQIPSFLAKVILLSLWKGLPILCWWTFDFSKNFCCYITDIKGEREFSLKVLHLLIVAKISEAFLSCWRMYSPPQSLGDVVCPSVCVWLYWLMNRAILVNGLGD